MVVFSIDRMLDLPRRTSIPGPGYIRLVARLADVDVAPPGASLPDRLGQWIDWTRAVALSRALDAAPASVDVAAAAPDADAAHDDCSRTRAALAAAIAGDPRLAPPVLRAGESVTAQFPDFEYFRACHRAHQQAMQAQTGRLRGQLRDRLAAGPPAMVRLADVDAVLEGVLSPKEQSLLAIVPGLLHARFDRLRRAAGQPPGDAHADAADDGWLRTFRRDLREALLAELDVRFQPLEGLLAALRHPGPWTP